MNGDYIMSLRLSMFVSDIQERVLGFKEKYMIKHYENPDQYPLIMQDGNEGLWLEFFLNFLDEGTV